MEQTSRTPPQTQDELFARAQNISGWTLAELASLVQEPVPTDTTHAKGWVGQLVEKALGATAASLAEPDFLELGVELKTVPVDTRGNPIETTYVCAAPLVCSTTMSWEKSVVYKKLSRVLWIPYQGEAHIPMDQKLLGYPLISSLDPEMERILKQDFEELVELIAGGKVEYIHADLGTYLHIRPKAAHGRARTDGIGEDGQLMRTLPRGFYLRTRFTERLFGRYFL